MFKGVKKFLSDLRKKSFRGWVSGGRMEDAELPQQIQTFNSSTGTAVGYENVYVSYGTNGPTSIIVSEPERANLSLGEDKRIEKKPVEVMGELTSELPKMNMTDIKGQIRVVEKRLKMLKKLKANCTQEEEVLGYLKARQKLVKYAHKFSWVTTNDTLLSKLCSTYKLRRVSLGSFSRNIPAEAIDEIEKFMHAVAYVKSDWEPNFELIIDDGGKEDRKDPILFVKSPFGRWYYMLGAWDEPVEVIDAIIYDGK